MEWVYACVESGFFHMGSVSFTNKIGFLKLSHILEGREDHKNGSQPFGKEWYIGAITLENNNREVYQDSTKDLSFLFKLNLHKILF